MFYRGQRGNSLIKGRLCHQVQIRIKNGAVCSDKCAVPLSPYQENYEDPLEIIVNTIRRSKLLLRSSCVMLRCQWAQGNRTLQDPQPTRRDGAWDDEAGVDRGA